MPTLEIRPGDEGVYHLAGEFDMDCQPLFDAWMRTFLAGPEPVTLDLSQLTFMDSTGIRCLLVLAERRSLLLRYPRPSVRRLLALTGLDTRHEITIEE